MRGSRAIFGATAALALVSCSLFVSLDGLSGDAGTADEGGAADEGIRDAATDAASSDAQQRSDAPFCASFSTPPTLCDDFDEMPLGAPWDKPDLQDAGTLSLDDASFLSSPNSLLVTIPDPPSDVSFQSVGLTKTWTSGGTADASRMHCELDLRVEENGTVGNFYVLVVTQTSASSPANFSSFSIIGGPGQWIAQEYESFVDGGEFEPPQTDLDGVLTGLWRHLVLDLNFKAQTVSYGVTDTHLDGTVADAGFATTSMIAPQDANARWISVGLRPNYAPSGTTTWQTRFDDVWCALTP